MNRILSNKGFIEFFQETEAIKGEVEKMEALDKL